MTCRFSPKIPCSQKTGCSMCGVFLNASRMALEEFHLKLPIPEIPKVVKP